MYKLIQKRNWLFAVSLAILVPGVVALMLWGLRLSIDFTGGARLNVTFSGQRPDGPTAATTVTDLNFGTATAITAGDHDMVINLPNITNEQRQKIVDTLNTSYQGVSEKSFETIGPTVGAELVKRAVTSIIVVLAVIILYVSWAFRRVGVGPVPSWVYGASAVVALAHDIFIVVGIFSILGHYFRIEIDSLFVTALLTVLGFSVHDTIVVFDRIRERLLVGSEHTFEETVNVSLNQTLVRSLNTSLTTLLVLTALYLFGGVTIRNFVLALLIGIASGTYSSIFVASPLLVVYERWKHRRQR
jgi:preprotein translocase subunit SecF